MSEQKYTIKPLKWFENKSNLFESFTCQVLGGAYLVERERVGFNEYGSWGSWRVDFNSDIGYNHTISECMSAEYGKEIAFSDWLSRITKALQPVES